MGGGVVTIHTCWFLDALMLDILSSVSFCAIVALHVPGSALNLRAHLAVGFFVVGVKYCGNFHLFSKECGFITHLPCRTKTIIYNIFFHVGVFVVSIQIE